MLDKNFVMVMVCVFQRCEGEGGVVRASKLFG
jgi:hypothetical protein